MNMMIRTDHKGAKTQNPLLRALPRTVPGGVLGRFGTVPRSAFLGMVPFCSWELWSHLMLAGLNSRILSDLFDAIDFFDFIHLGSNLELVVSYKYVSHGVDYDWSFHVVRTSKVDAFYLICVLGQYVSSTTGCPYGEECHFSHFVPGGVSSLGLAPLVNFGKYGGTKKAAVSNLMIGAGVTSSDPGTGLGGFKSRLCNKYNTLEGCRFGEKCHFAHGEKEMRKVNGGFAVSDRERLGLDISKDHLAGRGSAGLHDGRKFGSGRSAYREPTPPGMAAAAASFGASSTAKISIDASLVGAVIGKNGINTKQISRLTRAKISIRDHETDLKLKNVELEGSFEQIKLASQMVRELLINQDVLPAKSSAFGSHNYKTKMCEKFPQGTCTFGERCHFAHSENELQEAVAHS